MVSGLAEAIAGSELVVRWAQLGRRRLGSASRWVLAILEFAMGQKEELGEAMYQETNRVPVPSWMVADCEDLDSSQLLGRALLPA